MSVDRCLRKICFNATTCHRQTNCLVQRIKIITVAQTWHCLMKWNKELVCPSLVVCLQRSALKWFERLAKKTPIKSKLHKAVPVECKNHHWSKGIKRRSHFEWNVCPFKTVCKHYEPRLVPASYNNKGIGNFDRRASKTPSFWPRYYVFVGKRAKRVVTGNSVHAVSKHGWKRL